MSYFFAQLILAARNDDVKSWMNILIVVILAVFWAVAGILKARAQKPEQEEEQLADKPTRRRPQDVKGFLKEILQQPRRTRPISSDQNRQYRRQVEQLRRKINHPKPIVKPTLQQKPIFLSTLEALEESKLPKLKPEGQLGIDELAEPVSKTLKAPKEMVIPQESLVSETAIELLLDYEEPEKLRRAILHYEILGKPLSLREPT